MTRSIYFTSGQTGTGKTTLALALALRLKEEGHNVGYFKPFGWAVRGQATGKVDIDRDADFFKEILEMKEDRSIIQPISTGLGFMEAAIEQRGDFQDKIFAAFRELAGAYDFLIIEGVQGIGFLEFVKFSAPRLATIFSSDLIYIERADIARTIDNTIRDVNFATRLGANVPGVIITTVPPHAVDLFKGQFSDLLTAYSINIYGIIPVAPSTALAPRAKEVAEWLNGEILVDAGLDKEITHLSVGAMTPEQALRYFRRHTGKAVITGGDRTDICLAALETDTNCLILTGNIYPSVTVLTKAEEKNVPVILVPHDTLSTVRQYEKAEAIGTDHPRNLEQAKNLTKFLSEHVDFDAIIKLLNQ